jgi:phosphatidylserine/phosphatidylglycerophosphate/cardiolipin synthase-like enzyme/catechol 2,3-dioxygenase-like lactoylglutathione lyase family enzyme
VSEIRRNVGVITLFQKDLDQAIAFYTTVFGRPPEAADADSAKFHLDNTVINLEKESAAHDLIAPAQLAAQDAGSRVVFTIWVDDADAACKELIGHGVELINGLAIRPGRRTACFADPGGHLWEIAQELPQPATATPYLDAVERELKLVSPGLKGKVWKRTSGNAFDTLGDDPASWILQVPDDWGWTGLLPQGAEKPGVKNLLERIRSTVAQAERCVDITGFGVDITGFGALERTLSPAGPFPDGEFAKAMGSGLKEAARKASEQGRRLQVRVLSGLLGRGNSADPKAFHDELKQMIGDFYSAVDLNVALMITRGVTSYNHTKFIVVDGRHVIHGGINWMANYYYQDAYPSYSSVRVGFPGYGWGGDAPVTDLDIALRGPAALSAGKFLDELWTWTCANAPTPSQEGTLVRLATNNDRLDEGISTLYQGVEPKSEGQLEVIAVGSLGYGIKKMDPESGYQPLAVDRVEQAACNYWMPHKKSNNETNTDRDFMTVNPDANALRALIDCAKTNIVLSQQDINGAAHFPLYHALFDVRLFDILAAKMIAGVKVRIVISNPGYPDYSNINDVRTEAIQPLFNRVVLQIGSAVDANRVLKTNLQLAPLRVSDQPLWLNRVKYRLHTKVVLVDDTAFYVGSRNLYPDTTQDHGFIIEDATAAQQLKTKFLDVEWHYSKEAAIYDYENPSLDTPQLR